MRDLEIRGAGDLLGAEQSGFINDIGFETFQKILAESIEELKESEFKELYADDLKNKDQISDTILDTDLEILIPDNYVNKVDERLKLYQELDSLETELELEAFAKQLKDRFGPYPNEVDELLDSVRLRRLGQRIGFEKIVLKQSRLLCYFTSDQDSPYFQSEKFNKVLAFLGAQKQVQMKERNNKLYLSFQGVEKVHEAFSALRPILE